MIQQKTILRVIDNSGAKTVECLKVLGGFKRKYAEIGNIIVVTVKNLRNRSKDKSKVKQKEVLKALVLRTKDEYRKKNGFIIKFNTNVVSLVSKSGNPVGTRIIGPVSKILRRKFQRFVSIASGAF